jgi:hypothetical protein
VSVTGLIRRRVQIPVQSPSSNHSSGLRYPAPGRVRSDDGTVSSCHRGGSFMSVELVGLED